MQEVLPNIFTFQVKLPNSPLKAINSYVIKGDDRCILFDTGYNRPECEEDLLNGLHELGLEVADVDLVLTHLHADHTGLTNLFSEAGCKIYASEVDGNYANSMASGEYWDLVDGFRSLYGMQDNEIHIKDNPGYRYCLKKEFDFEILKDGDMLKVGEYAFEIIDLIGHTPGHIGFYDKNHKILISGDTVLDPMTPNITYWGKKYKSILGSYLKTLEKLKTFDIKLILPTHRKIIYNPYERMDQIIHHHYERMQEILDVMEIGKEYTVRDLSSLISWRIKADTWEDFPKSQKWFATGETMAHAEYLANLGYLNMTYRKGTVLFSRLC